MIAFDFSLELQTFLGLCAFTKQHIKNYGPNAALLADCLHSEKKPSGWCWSKKHSEAFKILKDGVLNPNNLHVIDLSKPSTLHVYTDSSDRCYGIVLVQAIEYEPGKTEYRLIDVVSKAIHQDQRHQSILRKEMGSLILSMHYFERFFINPDLKIVFWVDSQVLFALTENEGRAPKTHIFLNNCKTCYRPCEFRWLSSKQNVSDAPSRLVEHLDSNFFF